MGGSKSQVPPTRNRRDITKAWTSGGQDDGGSLTNLVVIIYSAHRASFTKVKVSVTQTCPAFCDPVDCSSPASSVHGILQARILEWVAIPFARGILPTQGLNLSLLHCRQILYPLSHQGTSVTMYYLKILY